MDTQNSVGSLPASHEAIADEVFGGHLAGQLPQPSAALDGLSLDEGLRVQLAVLERLKEAGETLGGWKVGMTSGPSLNRMGEGFRPFGFILNRRIYQSGAAVRLGQLGPDGIEAEIAFRIDRPLKGAKLDVAEIDAAVSGGIPAFELLRSRLPKGAANGAAVADNLTHWGIVLGQESSWKGDIGEVEVGFAHDGRTLATAGPGYAIDDPFQSISALCAQLYRFGLGLEPGQHVITGAFHRFALEPGKWSAPFKGLGTVEITAE